MEFPRGEENRPTVEALGQIVEFGPKTNALRGGRGTSRYVERASGDPSLRLKNGYAQDDPINHRRDHQKRLP